MTTSTSSPLLIGRSGELARLHEAFEQANAGTPHTVLVGGEAGIGKSRLLDAFLADVAGQARVLVGQCVDLGSVASPYAPIKSVLRSLVADVGAPELLAAAGPAQGVLAALLPELGAAGADVDTPSVRGQLHEAVAVILETFSRETPIVVVIEDIHWIDSASLSVLRFLERVLSGGRILLVLSVRTEDVTRGHPVRGFLSEVERSRSVDRIELSRLTRVQVRRQLKAIAGEAPSDALVSTLFARSDGIPFFVEELFDLEACADGGALPDTLRDLLLSRYERLSDETQRVLRIIAIGGVRVEHDLITSVVALSAEQLDDAVREAVSAGVLAIDGDAYAFRHALVREAVLFEVLPGERPRYHSGYARAYESRAGERRVAAEISFHWLSAHDDARAFPATIAAMREARQTYAYATAAQMGERALELWPRVDDSRELAGMDRFELVGRTASYLRNAGEEERALQVARHGLEECPTDNPHYARLLRDAALYRAALGRPGAIEELTEALRLVDPADATLAMTITTALAGRLMIDGRVDDALQAADRAHAMAVGAKRTAYASVSANIAAVSHAHRGELDAARAGLKQARQLAENEPNALLRYWVNASDLAYLLGEFAEAIGLAEEGMERARGYGVERNSGVVLASNAIDPLQAVGEWERADALIRRGLELDPPRVFQVYLLRARAWGMLWRGDVAAAAEAMRSLRPMAAPYVDIEVQTRLGIARVAAEVAIASEDWASAARELSPLFADDPAPAPGHALPLLWDAARVISAAPAAMPQPASRIRAQLASFTAWPTHDLWKAFIDAELTDDSETAVVAWSLAVEAARSPRAAVYLRPYALLQRARALIAGGARAEARTALDEAISAAESAGVGWIVGEAEKTAVRAGLTSGRVEPGSQVDDLTARERQVLELIAEGLSNRQIGERLFISGKTASVHVSAILRKLGASSRTEAAMRSAALR
ncbi:helix-turn-helix transcriptional regulator [Glaciibacter flavus]|uniref:helix-turn-helix transcriptional regulator n=1 Tax=Orlajensenia flava TaxID=2565934 RepID=UPI003AFF86F4